LKPENKDKLEHILGYHIYVGSLKTDYMVDGNEYDMVFGGKVKSLNKEIKLLSMALRSISVNPNF
jgi:hypothetical protein